MQVYENSTFAAPRARARFRQPLRGIVYGPVESRRLGRSLGVKLTPAGGCACSFDCVYCDASREPPRGGWPRPERIAASLAHALDRAGRLDSVTISGDGEPTLHPRFGAAVEAALGEARRRRPGLPVRILTNGSGLVRLEVRRALDRLDERIVKLDAATKRIDRPAAACPLGGLVHALTLLRDVTLQSCFVEGDVSNADDETLREWMELVGEIRPRAVQIYTIDRPATKCDVRPLSAARLERIARTLHDRTGVKARVYT
jgi:wyosine [tRNA(Phe)-imidazoG37] synthetase (radical SAM superfamily)